MRNLIERILKREQPHHNYVIGEYKPSRGQAASKPERVSVSEYDVDIPEHDEMEIDNIYKGN